MSFSRTFLGRPNASPQSPQYPLSIAIPAPEGPVTNDQDNHIIQCLQNINNSGDRSPNGGAARQLQPIVPAGGPPPPPLNAYGNGPCSTCIRAGPGRLLSLSKDIIVIDDICTKLCLIINRPFFVRVSTTPKIRRKYRVCAWIRTKFARVINYMGPGFWPTKSRGDQVPRLLSLPVRTNQPEP